MAAVEITQIHRIVVTVIVPAPEPGPAAAASPVPAPPTTRPGLTRPKQSFEPPYHVILLDDDEHTYAYVIEMLCTLFSHPLEKAFQMAQEVDSQGRVIVVTCHKELAELRKEQIESFGADPRIPASKGSMKAVIEPAA